MKEEMSNIEFIQTMIEASKKQEELDEFHELAEKYGMCTPWCHLANPCVECKK